MILFLKLGKKKKFYSAQLPTEAKSLKFCPMQKNPKHFPTEVHPKQDDYIT